MYTNLAIYLTGSDSDNELLETCLANTLQLDQDDEDIEVDDEDDDNDDDDNEDDHFDEPVSTGQFSIRWICVQKNTRYILGNLSTIHIDSFVSNPHNFTFMNI